MWRTRSQQEQAIAPQFSAFFCVCCGFVCVYALCFMLLSRVVALAARVKTMCSLALSSSFCIRKTSKIVYTFLINLKIGVRRIKKKWIELNWIYGHYKLHKHIYYFRMLYKSLKNIQNKMHFFNPFHSSNALSLGRPHPQESDRITE